MPGLCGYTGELCKEGAETKVNKPRVWDNEDGPFCFVEESSGEDLGKHMFEVMNEGVISNAYYQQTE